MNWTIAYNGTEKLLADWGLTKVVRKLVSQGMDELTFHAEGQSVDDAPLFANFADIILYRNRALAGGVFSGGTPWFSGLVLQTPATGSPNSEALQYKIGGPWWYLENIVFQQPYENIFLGYATAGDPTTPATYGTGSSSHLFLNQANVPNALQKISNGQQIIEALNWVLAPFNGTNPPFQIGAVTPDADIPIDEVRDTTCAEVIHKMLRWTPDAVAWFDYTTTPPTFNCKRRGEMTAFDLALIGNVKDVLVNPRYDLQVPSVQIFYETSSNINGTPSLSLTKDFYPSPLPTDPRSAFGSLQFTVDLQGINTTVTTAKLAVDPILPKDIGWWLARHPQYEPQDITDPSQNSNQIADIQIDVNTITRTVSQSTTTDAPDIADLGLTNELTSGQIAPWMTNFKTQRVLFKIMARTVRRNGQIDDSFPLTYQCLTTNATSGTFNSQQITQYPEPQPIGLAQFLYSTLNVLQYEGEFTLQEEDCSGALLIGQIFNVTGGKLTDWETMKAMPQEVMENLDDGTTFIRFGPPKNLSAGELVDLLRLNRQRKVFSGYSMRAAGAASDSSGSIDLGSNTPEKNSVASTGTANPHVVSGSVDGSGPTVTNSAGGGEVSTVWRDNGSVTNPHPAPGFIDITLSDAGGQQLFIRPIPVCLNGVSGIIYGLFSDFIKDP